MTTNTRGPFLPENAQTPDGSASNLMAKVRPVKSSGTAPGDYFYRALYDAATDTWLVWHDVMPGDYASGLTAKLIYTMNAATTGDVVWDVRIASITPADAADRDAKVFGSANTATNTVPGTAGHTKEVSITLTNADSLAAGDMYSIRVARNGTSGSDTATGDAELQSIRLEYTTT